MYRPFIIIWLACLLSPICGSAQKVKGYTIPFDPSTYLCMKSNSAIEIDGKGNEEAWQLASWSSTFQDIEGSSKPMPTLDTKFKMLWDDDYLYFYAKMEEPHVWATLVDHDDIIFYDDDIEIFIDINGDTHNYFEMEFNAYNTLWDLLLLRPYRVGGIPNTLFGWNPSGIKHAVHVEGTINDPSDEDKFWSLEVAIPWGDLREMSHAKGAPKNGEQWRLNFSRVDWEVETKDGVYSKKNGPDGKHLPEHNWVWSPTGVVNIHIPEMWGIVQFSDQAADTEQGGIVLTCEEEIKQELWRLYWLQKDHHDKTGTYVRKQRKLSKGKRSSNGVFELYAGPIGFDIIIKSCQNDKSWVIDETGRIRQKEFK